MARRRKAELVAAELLSPSVRSLVFRTLDRSAIGHIAGQYVDLIVPTARGFPFRRSYSIASPPSSSAHAESTDAFEIAVTRVDGGPTSEAIHALVPGEIIEMEGPAGAFIRRSEERAHPALFVATGTGLAPLRAMLAEDVRGREGPPLVLLFGCRRPHDVIWRDELRAWPNSCPRFRFHVSLSKSPPEWLGLTGYVQRHAAGLAAALPGVHVYVCGLSAMVDDLIALLQRSESIPREALHYETYD